MSEIKLQYLGKKNPCIIKNEFVGEVRFVPGAGTWIPSHKAEWLMKTNPKMFVKIDSKGEDFEDAADIIARDAAKKVTEDPKRELQCPAEGCDKVYTDEKWLARHIAKKHPELVSND